MQLFPFRQFSRTTAVRLLAMTLLAASACAVQAADDEAAFTAENAAAMDTMMAGMAVKPSGDIDSDFAAMMIPHHRGAIDMALAELRHGKNEQLRRIAQEIIVEQQQEIDAMHLALGQPPSPPAPAPTQRDSTASSAHNQAFASHDPATH